MTKHCTLLLVCLSLFSISYGATYYCSPSGGGSGTSLSSPTTFDAAFGSLRGGDTLYCLDGIYYYNNRITIGSSKQGSAARRTVIAAAEGHKPIFDFYQEPYGERGFVISTNVTYIHLRGLTLRYSGKNALLNQGSYCLFENLDVYGNGDTGIQMKSGGNNVILNCDSHDNFDYQTMSGGTVVNYGGNADGFADKQFAGAPNHYIGCRAWNNSDDAWDFFQRVTNGGDNILENCIAYNSGPVEYDLSDNPRVQTDAASWFNSFPKQVVDRHGNTITATLDHYPNIGNGNGFKIGGEKTANNISLLNCLAVGCAARGFDQNNNAGAMTVYNCTGYNSNPNYGFSNISGSSLTIRNSVSLSSKQNDSFQCPTVVSDHNSWNTRGVSCSSDDFASLDVARYILAPRAADGSLPVTPLLHLAENSDLIDAGVNVGLPYAGSAPDLGCYEFGDELNYPSRLTANAEQQTLTEGAEISPVVITWAGGATGVVYENLPQGISATISQADKSLTLTGSIANAGVYTVSLVSTQNEGSDGATLTITFYVKPANAYRVAYLTIPGSASDMPILAKLNNNLDFQVTILDASVSTHNFADYDLLVISSAPSSTSVGTMAAKGAQLPILLLKPFQLKNTAWNWANAVNTADASITVLRPEHPIFSNISLTAGLLPLFTAINKNAVTAVDQWYNGTAVEVLATASSNSAYQSVVEIPQGTVIGEETISHRFLMLGVSEYSTENLSADALTLINNACYYLLGVAISTSLESPAAPVTLRYGNASITADSELKVLGMTLYDATGAQVAATKGNTLSTSPLHRGVYVLMVTTDMATTSAKVFIK